MISDLIVSKFEGKIWFESEKDKGSTFTFTIKVQAFELEEEEDLDKSDSSLTQNFDSVYENIKRKDIDLSRRGSTSSINGSISEEDSE
jgi:hypothetical protein